MTDMSFEEWVQSRLTAHGYAVGPIDGHIGPLTIEAIKAFEGAHGLPINGTADPDVVELLRGSATDATTKANPIPERDKDLGEKANPPALKPVWPRQSGVPEFYGAVGTNQTSLVLPFPMRIAWDKAKTVSKITLHKKVADSAGRVFQRIAETYTNAKQRADLGIDLFGGSLNVRKMRGGSAYSMHSWGIAIDFDPERNQLKWGKDKACLAHGDCTDFWKAWADEGWLSLGQARNFDWMHVQAARL